MSEQDIGCIMAVDPVATTLQDNVKTGRECSQPAVDKRLSSSHDLSTHFINGLKRRTN